MIYLVEQTWRVQLQVSSSKIKKNVNEDRQFKVGNKCVKRHYMAYKLQNYVKEAYEQL